MMPGFDFSSFSSDRPFRLALIGEGLALRFLLGQLQKLQVQGQPIEISWYRPYALDSLMGLTARRGLILHPQWLYFDGRNRKVRDLSKVIDKLIWGKEEAFWYEPWVQGKWRDWHPSEVGTVSMNGNDFFPPYFLGSEPQLFQFISGCHWGPSTPQESSRLKGLNLSSPEGEVMLEADEFIFGDLDYSFLQEASAITGKPPQWDPSALPRKRPGYGVWLRHHPEKLKALLTSSAELWHQDQVSEFQWLVPLVGNPQNKEDYSHVAGCFDVERSESAWFGFLSDETGDDHGEVLKKVRLGQKALERVFAGWSDSLVEEKIMVDASFVADPSVAPRLRDISRIYKNISFVSDLWGIHHGIYETQDVFNKIYGIQQKAPQEGVLTV